MQVVITEKQRRDSELEHKHILEECNRVMEEYRIIERKLRNHIIKSRSIRARDGSLYDNSTECHSCVLLLLENILYGQTVWPAVRL